MGAPTLFPNPPGLALHFPPAGTPPAVEGFTGVACSAFTSPGLPGEGAGNPASFGLQALAEQIAAQSAATAALQSQLLAVAAEGQRRQEEML